MSEYDGFFHYLPVTDNAIRWGIYVTGAGRGVVAPGQRYPPASHPSLYRLDWQRGRTLAEFQMILITDGRGVFESARREVARSSRVRYFFFCQISGIAIGRIVNGVGQSGGCHSTVSWPIAWWIRE